MDYGERQATVIIHSCYCKLRIVLKLINNWAVSLLIAVSMDRTDVTIADVYLTGSIWAQKWQQK